MLSSVPFHVLFAAARDCGGAVSGEHGIGTGKREYVRDLENTAKVALMQRIKAAFDPHGILGPGRIFAEPAAVPAAVPAPLPSRSLDLGVGR